MAWSNVDLDLWKAQFRCPTVGLCLTIFGLTMTPTDKHVGFGRNRQVMINGNSFRKMVDSTASAVLVVGPMGAGKSTTIAIQTGAKYEAVKEEVEQRAWVKMEQIRNHSNPLLLNVPFRDEPARVKRLTVVGLRLLCNSLDTSRNGHEPCEFAGAWEIEEGLQMRAGRQQKAIRPRMATPRRPSTWVCTLRKRGLAATPIWTRRV